MNADLVVINGKIITIDSKETITEAFAVKNGKIVKVGSTDAIKCFIDSETKILDLDGKTVTPGLIDTHIHVVSRGSLGVGREYGWMQIPQEEGITLDVSNVKSIKELVNLLMEKITRKKLTQGEWILATGRFLKKLEEKRLPNKWDLDTISSDNPIFISSYPYAFVNTYLLNMAGITKETPQPPGGVLEKDPKTGEPTGVLQYGAIYRLLPPRPQPPVRNAERAAIAGQKALLTEGVTAYKDAGIRNYAIKAYQNLRMRNELLCRVHAMYKWLWTVEDAKEAADRFTFYGDDWLMFGAIKLSFDGSANTHTAWIYDDWNINYTNQKDVGVKGYPKIPPDEFKKMVSILHKAGLQICCHVVGDRAIDVYLDAIEEALESYPRQNCRHTLIHCWIPTDEAIERIKRLGDNVAIEPSSIFLMRDESAASFGPKRSKRALPFKTWLKKGITVGNSSDYPPGPTPPRLGIFEACTRRAGKGTYGRYPWGTEECITVQQALRTYTIDAARCLFWDDKIGSIEKGKYADFVVWDKDLYTIPVEELKALNVLMTIVNGKILYKREI